MPELSVFVVVIGEELFTEDPSVPRGTRKRGGKTSGSTFNVLKAASENGLSLLTWAVE